MVKLKEIQIDVANSGHITNSYLIYDTEIKNAVLIDPGDNPEFIIEQIKKLDLELNYIVITHAHGDHIGALEKVRDYFNSKVIIHKYDINALLGFEENYSDHIGVKQQNIDINNIVGVEDNQIIKDKNIEFEIIHTPGHTKGCICIYEKNLNVLFTGDTLFYNCYGRCDLNGGSFDDMASSLRKLYNRFDNIKIYPGHDKVVNIADTTKRIRLLIAINGGEL